MARYGDIPFAFKRSFTSNMLLDPKGITAAEDQEIRELWATMSGSSCYNDALRRIARGEA